MSTNGAHTSSDAEMADCDGEKVVTMMDVLQEQQEFEDDANAVLGASDDKNCTYNKGYIKRQAVYACLTCCNEAKFDPEKRAGVCLACSLTCHENHDLVELYTKRNFCCDCGNPKFSHPCQYTQNKTALNDNNIYNQNFSGLYCTCHRPYPDPDGVEEEMIQCIVCEDWLHASHLEATVPSSELYAEMICKGCMEKNEFLHDYGKYAVNDNADIVDINEMVVDDEVKKYSYLSSLDLYQQDNKAPESINTSHDNINENKAEKQLQLQDSISEKISNENAIEEKQAHVVVPDKTDDETTTEENQAKDVACGKADDENSTNDNPSEENQAKDMECDKGNVENSVEDKNSTKENQTKDKADENSTEESQAEDTVHDKSEHETSAEESEAKNTDTEISTPDDISGSKSSVNVTHESSTDQEYTNDAQAISNETNEEFTKINEQNDGPDNTDTNIEQNEKDKPIDMPQESNGGDISDEQQTSALSYKTNGEVNNVDPTEQDNSTDCSPVSAAGKDIDMEKCSEVSDNHSYSEDKQIKENKRKLSTEDSKDDISVKKAKLCESMCLRPQGDKKIFKGATFWPSHFRQKLCTCNECITMYKDLSVLFLIDPEDTVTAYETLGKEKSNGTASTQYERGLEALSSLGRIQQINALTEYNKMRDKLLDFLKSFKDRKEVVKEEDIKAFFAGMKPKREPDGVYFCR